MSRYFPLVSSTNLLSTGINKILLYMVKTAYLPFKAANKTNTDANVNRASQRLYSGSSQLYECRLTADVNITDHA